MFGSIPVGETTTRNVRIDNCSDSLPLVIEALRAFWVQRPSQGEGEPFTTDQDAPLTLEPGASIEVPVHFFAPGPGEYLGGFAIDFADLPTHEIPLTGTGI